MKNAARLVLAAALAASFVLPATSASATDCSNPKEPCGGCQVNPNFSTHDLRPIVCYA